MVLLVSSHITILFIFISRKLQLSSVVRIRMSFLYPVPNQPQWSFAMYHDTLMGAITNNTVLNTAKYLSTFTLLNILWQMPVQNENLSAMDTFESCSRPVCIIHYPSLAVIWLFGTYCADPSMSTMHCDYYYDICTSSNIVNICIPGTLFIETSEGDVSCGNR